MSVFLMGCQGLRVLVKQLAQSFGSSIQGFVLGSESEAKCVRFGMDICLISIAYLIVILNTQLLILYYISIVELFVIFAGDCQQASSFCTVYNSYLKMDKLLCILCRKSYKEPKMCSNCSEIYCQNCIKTYLSKHHSCPSCSHILPDLADCTRLIAQLKQHVKLAPVKKYKNCRLHSLPLKYQCMDCSIPICSDCGVIQPQHRGHRLEQRANINRQFPRGKLREYLVTVEQCILSDHSRCQQLILQRQVLKSQLKWCKNRLREYYQQMNKKLQEEANRLTSMIVDDLKQKETRMHKLKKLKDDISQIMDVRDFNDQEIIQKINPDNEILEYLDDDSHEQMFNKLQQLIEEYRQRGFFNFNRKSLTTLNQIYPEYINHTYQFNYEAHQNDTIKYSQPFHIYGQEWRLKIYPKGNGQSPNHLSLFLQLLNAPNPVMGSKNNPQQYYFRLQLISLNTAGKTISKQYRSPFTTGDCWGYNDFVRLSELSEYLNNGHLIFVIGIRNCSYFDICQNMRRYIRKLQGQKKVLQQLLSTSDLEQVSAMELTSIVGSHLETQ